MERKPQILVSKEAHAMLKEYCKQNGYNMGGFIESLIRKYCIVENIQQGKKLLLD